MNNKCHSCDGIGADFDEVPFTCPVCTGKGVLYSAYLRREDGQTWLRFSSGTNVWEEPISGWSLVMPILGRDVSRGSHWRHSDGREAINDSNPDY